MSFDVNKDIRKAVQDANVTDVTEKELTEGSVVYHGNIPEACDNCYLIRRIELYVGKVGSICPISGYGRTKGRRSIACPFVCVEVKKNE